MRALLLVNGWLAAAARSLALASVIWPPRACQNALRSRRRRCCSLAAGSQNCKRCAPLASVAGLLQRVCVSFLATHPFIATASHAPRAAARDARAAAVRPFAGSARATAEQSADGGAGVQQRSRFPTQPASLRRVLAATAQASADINAYENWAGRSAMLVVRPAPPVLLLSLLRACSSWEP